MGQIVDDQLPYNVLELIGNDCLADDVSELVGPMNDYIGGQAGDGHEFTQVIHRGCSQDSYYVEVEDTSFTDAALYDEAVINLYLTRWPRSMIHSLFPNKPNMSSIELWIIQFLIDWSVRHQAPSRYPQQLQMWDDVRTTLYATSELIQSSMYAFSGLMFLSNHNCHYLLGDTPIDDGSELSVAKIYNFAMNSYSYLLSASSRQMARVLNNTCTVTEAKVLLASLTFLYTILEKLPPGTCPLVDFTKGGNDFIKYNIGFRQTYTVLQPLLQNSPYEIIQGPTTNRFAISIPVFVRILEFIDNNTDGLGTTADVSIIRHAFAILDQQIYHTTVALHPLEYHPIFSKVSNEFWDLVYAQNTLALSWLNVLAAYALVFESYYIRDNNIWVEYMNWYRAWHGQNFFWDEPIYQAVVEQGYCVTDYALLRYFNPLECAIINEIS
ncbi:hypothetical protein DIURU_002916 [Diutina rugosa]|uniref:Transcription factor domain-containing protein n=1 Tax=Diutina rugosa TaxID=5481 RepID=A0A642UN21_DIURU|nr:uncharacterized protein DIURU_002916 [Diutina rugosa]KAA8902122.1 hypothetical protein DIURU_002916 [Diutina rugosa]